MSIVSDASHTLNVTNGFAFDSLESVRKKLLDLSGRNALLNYKHPKASCIRLIDELPDQLVEQLQKGTALTFIPVPEPTERELIEAGYIKVDAETKEAVVNGHPTAEQWAKYIGFETTYDLPEISVAAQGLDYHQDNDMQTLMYAPELEARLRSLRSKAETAIEEGGANILYLGVGFLEWIESRNSDIKRLSPLFTVPVKLDRATQAGQDGAYRYSITMKDDGLITNITLREKLANDFGLLLPSIEDDTTPEGYFSTVEKTILQHQPQWCIRRQASLVLLNFTKQAMYQDLDPNNWPDGASIEDHPLIQMFFSAAIDGETGGSASYEDEHPLDHVEEIHDRFPIVFDADSSQHSALIDAVNGENLVIEGPPGSGKSQTIANLIAACIGSGKSVLFVAEKMAALNVVKDRLDKARLGDFCLELHSHKTNKQKILGDLDARLQKQAEYHEPKSIKVDIARFEDLKKKLSEYVALINSQWANTGLTLHDIFNKATRYREQLTVDPEALKVEGIDGNNLTLVRQKELLDQADMLAHIYELVAGQAPDANIANHYWYGINNTELMGYQADKLSEALSVWTTHLQQLSEHWLTLNSFLEMDISNDSQLSAIENVAASIEQLPELVGGELFDHLEHLIDQVDAFQQWLQDYEEIHQCHDKLTPNVKPDAIGDVEVLVKIKKALEIFQKLGLAQNSTLEEVAELHTTIQSTIEHIANIDQQFAHIKPSLPQKMGDLFVSCRSGLEEVNILINLITALPQELWRYRDNIYDNPDLDPLLEAMTEQLRDLTPLHQALHEQFSLHRLPDSEALKQHRLTIENCGFFKWFSSDWRQSRKAILALGAAPKPKVGNLLSALPNLIRYVSGVEAMDRLNKEDGALHDLYKGVDTPMERVIALRQWYKAVRAEYGLGFGDRVALGSALLSLDRTLAMGIKDYANQGMGPKIKMVLSALSGICKAVHAYSALADASAVIEPPLSQVSQAIKTQLSVLQNAAIGAAHELGELGEVCVLIEQQHRRVNTWRRNALAGALLEKGLPLSSKAGEFSQQHLALGRNTIAMLKVLTTSPELLNSLLAKPDSERYRLIQSSLEALQQHLAQCASAGQQFTDLGKVNLEDWMENSQGVVNALIARNNTALENPNWLNTWLDYIRLRLKLSGQGLDKIVTELERSQIETTDLNDVVQLVMNHQLAGEILDRHSELALFSGIEQMANRKKFQEYDNKIMTLQRELVAFKASRIAPPVGVSQGKIRDYTELSLIRHNLNLKRPKVAMRSLIRRSGRAMQALKPCFMMSPMSVAQYLEPGQFKFDLVVMDEASQIRPEDALGAIARADSLVVVGDPKQLPPTSFFQKVSNNQDNEDEAVALEASESILESVIPMFKNRRLRWHYRSRHESLIAFSNQRFYDSNLILFPSPMKECDEFGIRYSRVNRGRFVNSRNVEEAREVVRSAADQMITSAKESVGIVSMNAEQSDEIERQFEQLIKDDPALQQAYEHNQNSDEPLFVKNLESVQGDERDVIIISMTYGPDAVGATSMHQRFGPITQEVGWRRLNVLFTRSKKRMHVFSSMDSGHIRTSENSKRGMVALKAFLVYCETGSLQHYEHTGKVADSDFEIAVMNALADYGYQCEPQLGVTGYFLDLAVKDPGQPGRFLMGIECDGASYHSAKSTRDRDRLRQDILENLGWEIHRIWSTDWFKNPQAQLAPILRRLEELRTPTSELVESVVVEELLEEDINAIATIDDVADIVEMASSYKAGPVLSLRSRLRDYDQQVIRLGSLITSEDRRLLRPSMLDALLDALPCSKAEFLEMIPQYLRNGTAPEEGKYLDAVLEIITDYG
jgi:very-short-patch-repair endonuclease